MTTSSNKIALKAEEFLDSVECHFWKRNVFGLKLDEVATFLWIRRQSLYHYFPNKEAFVSALVERSFKKRISELRSAMKTEGLREFVEWLLLSPSATKSVYSAAHAWNNYQWTHLEARIAEMQGQIRNEAIGYAEKRFHVSPARKFVLINASRKIVEAMYHGTLNLNADEVVEEFCRIIDPDWNGAK